MKLLSIFLTFLLVSVLWIFFHSRYALESYLISFAFWFQLPLGALSIIFLHQLTGGKCGNEAEKALNLLMDWKNTLVRVVPFGQQEEQRFATA